MNSIECTNCGYTFDEDEGYFEVDGDIFCDDCYDERFSVCDECGQVFNSMDGGMYSEDYGLVCETCLENDFESCACCGEYHRTSDMQGQDNLACDRCLSVGDMYLCDNCGEAVSNDDIYWDDYLDEHICPDCYHDSERQLANGRIYGYHSGPRGTFTSMPDEETSENTLYFGLEFETEFNYSIEDACSNIYHEGLFQDNLFVPEYDGSLNNGIEFISAPMTYRYIMESGKIEGLFRAIADNDGSAEYRNCGLHVHLSQAAFGETRGERAENILKFSTILYRYSRLLQKLAGRNFNNYSGEIHLSNTAMHPDGRSNCTNTNKYTTINVTQNTVEIRLFAGTDDLSVVRRYIQFCDYLVHRVKSISVEDSVCMDSNWIFKYLTEYQHPEFYHWLAGTQYLSKDKQKQIESLTPVWPTYEDLAEEYGEGLLNKFAGVFNNPPQFELRYRILNDYINFNSRFNSRIEDLKVLYKQELERDQRELERIEQLERQIAEAEHLFLDDWVSTIHPEGLDYTDQRPRDYTFYHVG